MLFLSFFDFARFCKGGRVPFSKQGVPYVCAPTVNVAAPSVIHSGGAEKKNFELLPAGTPFFISSAN